MRICEEDSEKVEKISLLMWYKSSCVTEWNFVSRDDYENMVEDYAEKMDEIDSN